MSRKKIRKPPPPREGIERWRCPTCQEMKMVLVFRRPTPAEPVPPDPSFVCQNCDGVWSYKTGATLLGDKAARAALRVLQIQRKV